MKGGGELIVYFSSVIPSKKLTLPRAYKTLEAVAVESRIGRTDTVLSAIYRPPRPSRKGRKMPPEEKYLQKLEEEINDICQWASFQKQKIVTAKSGVQNQISVLSKTARPRQTTDRLYNRRLQDNATLTFKVKHSLVPVNISDLFNLKNTEYNLRKCDFELPRFETVRFGRNSIKYMGPLIWSKLPRHLRMIETLNSFKRNIRKVDLSTLVNIYIRCFRLFNKLLSNLHAIFYFYFLVICIWYLTYYFTVSPISL